MGKITMAALMAGATVAAVGPLAAPADAGTGTDFRVAGVRIWANGALNDPYSGILGLGYPGQGFDVDMVYSAPAYTCDNGVTSWTSLHGRDIATGVTGFVPSCNTTW
ncbi:MULTISPECIES: hypothetical protein [Actinoallomurus]|uniref:hypothetical protein n=1 Tax=Actinoallomurus TaxID=667113 RepID=UPI002091B0E7|nr:MULTISPECIES: hypothetical protein [Actinoallomurus]MCO5967982.1 hypothetical protein [Actinoallomurus soli]MCO5994568.1 hypothetical protein [Actinoallomurus rhizosphaericola]